MAGIRELYSVAAGDDGCCELIRGTVGDASVAGGQFLVWAEDGASGEVLSSVAASKSGVFELAAPGMRILRLYAREMGVSASAIVDLGEYDPKAKKLDSEEGRFPLGSRKGRIEGVGINGELSGLAIPLNKGNTYRIYVAVTGWPVTAT